MSAFEVMQLSLANGILLSGKMGRKSEAWVARAKFAKGQLADLPKQTYSRYQKSAGGHVAKQQQRRSR